LPGISIYFGFSHRVFQSFKTFSDEQAKVPTQDQIDQGGVLRLISISN